MRLRRPLPNYPITSPPGRRVSRARAAGGLSEAEVRAILYPPQRADVQPLGTTVDRLLASVRGGRVVYDDLGHPWD